MTQCGLILCDPVNCSTPVFPVLHYFPEFTQTHVNPTISFYVVPFSSCLQCFPATGSFPMRRIFPSDGPSIEASALASVLPVNTQDWFPLELTGLISLQSKGFSRVSNTTVQCICRVHCAKWMHHKLESRLPGEISTTSDLQMIPL